MVRRSNDGVGRSNDFLAPENDVSADDVDANDGPRFSDGCRDPEVTGGWHDGCLTAAFRDFFRGKVSGDASSESNNSGDFVTYDSREKLEADIRNFFGNMPIHLAKAIGWLDRQAEITRKTEQTAWIQQANGEIYQAKAERDRAIARMNELVGENEALMAAHVDDVERIDELQSELEKRDKGIERLKKRRDELAAKVDYAESMIDSWHVDTVAGTRISKLLRQRDVARAERDELKAALDAGSPPVVFCRDCRHSRTERHTGDALLACWVRKTHGEVVDPLHFCGKGRPRVDAS